MSYLNALIGAAGLLDLGRSLAREWSDGQSAHPLRFRIE
jgi:hypothetical protein